MKKYSIKVLITSFILLLVVFVLSNLKTINASSTKLIAGTSINLNEFSDKNLENVNIKIEFTTNINLDGENNALLIAISSSDNTLITDQRFIAKSTKVGIFDEDDIALVFENPLSEIGTKVKNGGYYTYTIETKDFVIIDGTKNISKLVVIGQKGAEISAELSIIEVKYSVEFIGQNPILYSYNQIIEEPEISYSFDINGHYLVESWIGDDSSVFVTSNTHALKDIVYTASLSNMSEHSWLNHSEVKATRNHNGAKAYEECTVCGAKRLIESPQTLASESDLLLVHNCVYNVTFNWANANNPGDKPNVTYTCSDKDCGYSIVLPASLVTMAEKEGSRIAPTYDETGSVIFIARASYENQVFEEEKLYVLDKTTHVMTYHQSVPATCTTDGTIAYYSCSECNKFFSDALGKNEISDIIEPMHHTLVHHEEVVGKDCITYGTIEHDDCIVCHKLFGGPDHAEIDSATGRPGNHDLIHHDALASTCDHDGNIEYWECTICHKLYTNESTGPGFEVSDVTIKAHHTLVHNQTDVSICSANDELDYYYCTSCYKFYKDSEANEELVLKKHTLVKHNSTPATCEYDGNIEYYECSTCHKKFSDLSANTEIEDVVIKGSHELTKIERVDATCTTTGNIEYYHCSKCGNNYDEEGNIVKDTTIPYSHMMIKYIAHDATCEQDGNIEYYHCNVCNKNFRDVNGVVEIEDVIIHSTGHIYGSDNRCTVCGKTKPNSSNNNLFGCFSIVSSSSLLFVLATFSAIIIKKKKESIE